MKKNRLNISGWINLDKPAGITSTDALNKVRRALNAAKAGHAGTLDPLATGILPIALGEATKVLHYVTDTMKEYRFTVTWGEARDTDDSEGKITATSPVRPTEASIRATLPRFTGDISQLPPRYSAIKINGERAYDLAREGAEFEIKPRNVYVEVLTFQSAPTPDTAIFFCRCGKGTYVRSLARDMAEVLGTKGHISALRRLKVGCFDEKTSISLDSLTEAVASSPPPFGVLPLESALDDIPALSLTTAEAARLKQGQTLEFLARADVDRLSQAGLDPRLTSDTLALATFGGNAVALLAANGPVLHPVRVFNR